MAVILIVGREFFISAFRLVAVEKGVVIAASGLGKAKTVSQFIAITLTLLQAPSEAFWAVSLLTWRSCGSPCCSRWFPEWITL